MNSTAPLFQGAPIWLTLPFALIAAGVVFALLILFWGARLAARRREANAEIEDFNEEYAEAAPARPITPPVAPPPPPIAEPPVAAPAPVAAPEPVAPPPPPPAPEPAPEPVAEVPPPTPAPEPVAAAPAPEPVAEAPAAEPAPEPVAEIVPTPPPPAVEEAPEPAPLADEPIAAAAPLDASPASLAADIAEPAAAEPAPEAAPAPAPATPAADDLTRMKGVGPRLGEKLNSVGITSFAQLAALTPEEADALDAKLGDFQGRIHRDRWIEQAGFLAKNDIAGFEGVFGKL